MKTIKATVYKADTFRNLPRNAEAFITFFQEKLNLIPEEFRSSATIDLETSPFYDSTEETLEVYYIRPETEEEIQAREREAAIEAVKQELKKAEVNERLAQLEKLKSERGL
jgi:hypothetical protein